jgi:hypothetical protein
MVVGGALLIVCGRGATLANMSKRSVRSPRYINPHQTNEFALGFVPLHFKNVIIVYSVLVDMDIIIHMLYLIYTVKRPVLNGL